MPSRAHQKYRINIALEPARDILVPCCAKSPRGSKPWAPIVLLRCLLLSLLVGPRLRDHHRTSRTRVSLQDVRRRGHV
jgi:hypothetical protein